jgi:hypothetical protein
LFAIYVNDIVSRLPFGQNYVIVLYADDILLLPPSVTELQTLLSVSKIELAWLDLPINTKKSCCMRIEPRRSIKYVNIVTASALDGRSAVSWCLHCPFEIFDMLS